MHGLLLAASTSSRPGRGVRRTLAALITTVLVAAGIPLLAQPAYAGTSDITVVFDDTASANAVPAGVLTVDVYVDGAPTTCSTTGCSVAADAGQSISAQVTIDNDEWIFAGWGAAPVCAEGVQSQTFCSWDATGPVTLTAKVTPRNLSTITITAPTNGTVDLSQSVPDGYFVNISCPGTCTTKVDRSADFSVVATPDPGYDFAGWSFTGGTISPACDTSGFCDTRATSSALTIGSSFTLTPTTAALTIARTPTAGGSVAVATTSTLFTCGTTCTGDVPLDTTFTLTATPAAGYRVVDWSGVFCDEFPVGDVCTVSGGIGSATTATVTFELTRTVTLAASFTPSGGGATVSWETSGFDFGSCTFPGAACTIPVPDGQSVTLTPTGDQGTTFTSWGGVSCASASCTFTPSTDLSVTAAFTVVGTSVVTVKRTGGLGSVDVIGDGFTVLAQCTAAALATVQGCTTTVTNGQPVTLAASPDSTTDGSRSVVASWTSCTQAGDEQAGAVCTITPSGNRTVTVNFDQVADGALTVSVVKAGGGALPNGALVSAFLDQAADIDCGTSSQGVAATACTTKSRLHTGVALFVDVPPGYTVSATGCDLDEFLRCRLYLETASAVTITYTSVGTWTVTLTKTGWTTGEQLSASSPSSFVTCPNTADPCQLLVTKGDPVFIFGSTGAQNRKVTLAASTLCPADPGPDSIFCGGTPTADVTVPVTWSANTTRPVSAAVVTGDEAGGSVSLPGTPACSFADTCAARGLGIGRTVTVSAFPEPGWVFTSWTGCPVTSTSSTCTFTVVAGTQIDVKANFTNVGTWRVTVNAPSTVHGLVGLDGTSCLPASPGGSVSCFVDVTKGDSAFAIGAAENGWTPVFAPACAALTASSFCTVTPTADTTITVTFTDTPMSTVTFVATPAAAADLLVDWPGSFFFDFPCGSTCVVTAKPGTDLLVDAGSPSPGYMLKSWSGCDSQAGYRCEVATPGTAGANTTVTADFLIKADTPLHTLTVVNPSSAEIDVDPMEEDGFVGYDGSLTCSPGGTCTVQVFEGQKLMLSASPAATWAVSGTGSAVVGGCTVGASECGVLVGTANLTVTTTSAILLTVNTTGSGTVTSSPTGITCGDTCASGFAPGAVVTLTAAPASGWVFAGWSGACTGTAATCQVTMSTAKTVGARFAAVTTLQAEGTTGVTKTWASVAASGTYGGSEWRSDSPGSSVSHTFTGTSVTYFFSKTASSGTAIVKVDGVTKATVKQYSSTTKLKQKITISGLTNASHTISVTVSPTKPTGSKGTVVAVDAFARNSTSCGTGCAVTPTVSAAWARVSLASASGGAYVQARNKGASLTWSFTGSSIVVYRIKGVDKGKLGVYLDGVLKGTLNDYATSTKVTTTGTSFKGLPVKAHTLKIVVLGVLGSSSKPTSLNVAIDRAVVTG